MKTVAEMKAVIDEMDHLQMATLYRNSPAGHPYFSSENMEVYQHFMTRFNNFGGFTPKISKTVGWGG